MSSIEERSVIGCLMMDSSRIQDIYHRLTPEMFEDPLMGQIYREIVKAYDIGQSYNLITITQAVESDSFPREYIGEALRECALLPLVSGEIKSYADSLVKEYKARELRRVLSNTQVTAAGIDSQIANLLSEPEALKKSERVQTKKLLTIISQIILEMAKRGKQIGFRTGSG